MAANPKNKGPVLWVVDPTSNLKEAIGFLKDWVTTLLSLQTTLIAAVAAFVGFRGPGDLVRLTSYELRLLGLAAVCSLASIFSGVFLLNMLPAAVQRVPTKSPEHPQDLFSIKTTEGGGWDPTQGRTILFWSRCFRVSFLAALLLLVVFVALKVSFS